MQRKTGLRRCALGFVLLGASPFLGSLSWLARLLGLIGLANGAALWEENMWMVRLHRCSVYAVPVFALLEMVRFTGLAVLPPLAAAVLHLAVTVLLAVCLICGLRKHDQEETK